MIKEYFKEDGTGSAQVHKKRGVNEFFILYLNGEGERLGVEHFPEKSIHYVEDAAENWVLGIKTWIDA